MGITVKDIADLMLDETEIIRIESINTGCTIYEGTAEEIPEILLEVTLHSLNTEPVKGENKLCLNITGE